MGDEDELEPGGVDRERVGRQVRQPGGFGVADLSFGAAASAVKGFEVPCDQPAESAPAITSVDSSAGSTGSWASASSSTVT